MNLGSTEPPGPALPVTTTIPSHPSTQTGAWRGFAANPPLFDWMGEEERSASTVDSVVSTEVLAHSLSGDKGTRAWDLG